MLRINWRDIQDYIITTAGVKKVEDELFEETHATWKILPVPECTPREMKQTKRGKQHMQYCKHTKLPFPEPVEIEIENGNENENGNKQPKKLKINTSKEDEIYFWEIAHKETEGGRKWQGTNETDNELFGIDDEEEIEEDIVKITEEHTQDTQSQDLNPYNQLGPPKAISDTSKTPIQELHHGYSKVASARLIRKRGLQSALEPSPGSALPPQNAERQAILDTINRSVQKALIAAKADYPIPHLPANFIPPPMLDDASLHSRSDPMFCRVSSGYRELLAQQKIMDARVRKAEIEEAKRRQNERAEELEAERIRIREREHPKEIDRDGSGHIANTANVTPQVIRLNTPAHPHVKPEVTIQIRNPNTPMGLAALKRKE